jgi:uncharacterized protein (TIGR00369 family)
MRELNPEHIREVIDLINRGPFFRHLSLTVKELGKGYSLVELEIGEEHFNPFGGLHGGVYASAIDTAAYWAVYCDLDENLGFTSLDLTVDFLTPATTGKIVVKGRCLKVGKTICLAEATAFDQEEKWLAHGLSKVMIVPGSQSIKAAVDFLGAGHLPPKFLNVSPTGKGTEFPLTSCNSAC